MEYAIPSPGSVTLTCSGAVAPMGRIGCHTSANTNKLPFPLGNTVSGVNTPLRGCRHLYVTGREPPLLFQCGAQELYGSGLGENGRPAPDRSVKRSLKKREIPKCMGGAHDTGSINPSHNSGDFSQNWRKPNKFDSVLIRYHQFATRFEHDTKLLAVIYLQLENVLCRSRF